MVFDGQDNDWLYTRQYRTIVRTKSLQFFLVKVSITTTAAVVASQRASTAVAAAAAAATTATFYQKA